MSKITPISVALIAYLTTGMAISSHIDEDIIKIAEDTIDNPKASVDTVRLSRNILNGINHAHNPPALEIEEAPALAKSNPLEIEKPTTPEQILPPEPVPTPKAKPNKKIQKVENFIKTAISFALPKEVEKPMPATDKEKVVNEASIQPEQPYLGIYRNSSALGVIEDLVESPWMLQIEDGKDHLSQTKINYYTERGRIESINEIVSGLGLKMIVFTQLKLLIITK